MHRHKACNQVFFSKLIRAKSYSFNTYFNVKTHNIY
jgi:hypothetical protein